MMMALSRPHAPARLGALLVASLGFFATVALAVYALLWIIDDQRSGAREGGVAGAFTAADLNLPPGLVAVQRVADAGEFEDLAGFAPFIPVGLPETTQAGPSSLALTLPDEQGRRVGRVGFSPTGEAVDGIAGPTVVLIEAPGAPGESIDGELRRITSGTGRTLAAAFACRGLVIDAQLYFQPAPSPGEPFVTPWMTDVAQRFIDGVRAQCAEPSR